MRKRKENIERKNNQKKAAFLHLKLQRQVQITIGIMPLITMIDFWQNDAKKQMIPLWMIPLIQRNFLIKIQGTQKTDYT